MDHVENHWFNASADCNLTSCVFNVVRCSFLSVAAPSANPPAGSAKNEVALPNEIRSNESEDFHMKELLEQLTALLDSNPSQHRVIEMGESPLTVVKGSRSTFGEIVFLR